ncbi:MAG: hypothetical protein GX638_04930, partial [Crenarchaeota archaeon]|nr:hypothetical protein [Thermoproteota archaeon]
IRSHKTFNDLNDDIICYIHGIISNFKTGFFKYDDNNWPLYWEVWTKKENKENLIKVTKIFTSNHYSHFGRLLTPLVGGIRIEGPLFSEFFQNNKKEVILRDGQGLGHEGNLDLALSIKTLDLLKRVEKIILVDNGEQPMIGLTLIALEQIFSRGLSSKLAIAFTRFDLIEADDLPTLKDKQNRLKNSIIDSLNQIYRKNKSKTALHFAKNIDSRVFFLGYLDGPSEKITGFYKEQLIGLCNFFFIDIESHSNSNNPPLILIEKSEENEFLPDELLTDQTAIPPKVPLKINYKRLKKQIDVEYNHYFQDFDKHTKKGNVSQPKIKCDINRITDYLFRANIQFRILWDMRLFGRTTIKNSISTQYANIGKENWSVVKALTRRVVSLNELEYRHLRPVSEYCSFIATELSCFFSENIQWDNCTPQPVESLKVLDRIRFEMSKKTDTYILDILIRKNINLWETANTKSGTGSAAERANVLLSLFDLAVPIDLSSRQWHDLELIFKNIVQDLIKIINADIGSGKIAISGITNQSNNVLQIDEQNTKEIIQYITEILIKFELSVHYSKKQFIGLLDDYCKNSLESERKKIILSINENIPEKIMSDKQHLTEDLINSKLVKQLKMTGISDEYADWIIKCWMISINISNEIIKGTK